MIITYYGTNTVAFDWLSQSDLSGYEGDYCLRLTANDLYDDQAVPATTTLEIDNKNHAPFPLEKIMALKSTYQHSKTGSGL